MTGERRNTYKIRRFEQFVKALLSMECILLWQRSLNKKRCIETKIFQSIYQQRQLNKNINLT